MCKQVKSSKCEACARLLRLSERHSPQAVFLMRVLEEKSDACLISQIYPEMQKARKGELCSAETEGTEGVTSSQIRIYFGKQVKDQVQLKARSHLQGAVSHPGS